MRLAQIENGIVVNVIEAASIDAVPGAMLMPSETANIGDKWDGQKFIPVIRTYTWDEDSQSWVETIE